MAELNLMPYKLKQRQLKSATRKKYTAWIVIVAIVLIVIVIVPIVVVSSLDAKNEDLENQIQAKNPIMIKNISLTNQINSTKAYLNRVDALTSSKQYMKDDTTYLQQYIPKDVTIKSLSIGNKKISIQAQTVNYNSATEFVANLQQAEKYLSATLNSISSDGKKYSFTVDVVMNGSKAAH